MNEPTIQFRALTVTETNMVLDGLKHLPLGHVNDLFHELRNEAQRQIEGKPVLKAVEATPNTDERAA